MLKLANSNSMKVAPSCNPLDILSIHSVVNSTFISQGILQYITSKNIQMDDTIYETFISRVLPFSTQKNPGKNASK